MSVCVCMSGFNFLCVCGGECVCVWESVRVSGFNFVCLLSRLQLIDDLSYEDVKKCYRGGRKRVV